MKGFKEFLLQGNVVELAIAVVIAGAFGKVIDAMVTVIMDLIGKLGGTPNFSGWTPGGVHIGAFLTAVVAFIVLALVVYLMVVKPYQALQARSAKPEDAAADAVDPNTVLLAEIRDALRARG